MSSCIFCRIVKGDLPAEVIYEDDQVLAFRDINAQAPIHCLVIPKEHVQSVAHLGDEHNDVLCSCFAAIRKVAKQLSVTEDGFRVVANTGDHGGQTVHHLHFHLLGGRQLHWPPG